MKRMEEQTPTFARSANRSQFRLANHSSTSIEPIVSFTDTKKTGFHSKPLILSILRDYVRRSDGAPPVGEIAVEVRGPLFRPTARRTRGRGAAFSMKLSPNWARHAATGKATIHAPGCCVMIRLTGVSPLDKKSPPAPTSRKSRGFFCLWLGRYSSRLAPCALPLLA